MPVPDAISVFIGSYGALSRQRVRRQPDVAPNCAGMRRAVDNPISLDISISFVGFKESFR